MIYESILDLIGNTPIVKLTRFKKKFGLDFDLYAKIEKNNPAGSVKDRIAYAMLQDAIDVGQVTANTTIIEPTSGNTGIALACLGNYYNLPVIIVMPSSMSVQRQQLIKAYGARLILVDGNMTTAINKAKELQAEIGDAIILNQFDNKSNQKMHYQTTGVEIYNDLPDLDVVIAGIGTGGTISGVAKFLKEKKEQITIIGIEPKTSPIISKGYSGSHKIQGIGAGFIPGNLDLNLVDQIITVSDEEAILYAKEIVKTEGIFVGLSSGAALGAAIKVNQEMNLENKKVLVILPDTGERYQWN